MEGKARQNLTVAGTDGTTITIKNVCFVKSVNTYCLIAENIDSKNTLFVFPSLKHTHFNTSQNRIWEKTFT